MDARAARQKRMERIRARMKQRSEPTIPAPLKPDGRFKTMRAGAGLGDSIYLQSVARYFVQRGQRIEVRSDWPDVFRPLGDMVRVRPFARNGIDILAHYSLRKGITTTNQFQDCCIQAGIKEPVELCLDWPEPDTPLVRSLRDHGKPVVLVQLPRAPMGRRDGFGADILPNCESIQTALDAIRDRVTLVQIGSGTPLFHCRGLHVDLANKTSIPELLDLGKAADACIGYCSYMIPLAESFNKPALMVWSRRGLNSRNLYVARITPAKIIHKASTRAVIDDDPRMVIADAACALL